MEIESRAGQLPKEKDLIDLGETLRDYYQIEPNVNEPEQAVVFGTSGHRGAAENGSFNAAHIVAITQAIVEYRASQNVGGTIFVGFDTHFLSLAAFRTCLEILSAAGVNYSVDSHVTVELLDSAEKGKAPRNCAIWTPTPAVSRAILRANAGKADKNQMADGIIITPSHNPPRDGGIKYNPEHGGAADSDVTKIIEARANELLRSGAWKKVSRTEFSLALEQANRCDFRAEYVAELAKIIDMDAISAAGVRIGADSLGGASIDYWPEIARAYGLNLTVINEKVDPTFRFVTLDWDEKIRMDCSSPNSMAGTLQQADSQGNYDLLTGNDADSDRHGIIARSPKTDKFELMNPNHFLAVAIAYLFGGARPNWPAGVGIGKTLVSSSLIDRVAAGLRTKLFEVPVGFKWFVDDLLNGKIGFAGEESAGASFLNRDGEIWTTDKDGIIMALLAAEILAKTAKSPIEIHSELTERYGESWYARIDAPATPAEKIKLSQLSPEQVSAETLAGETILAKLTNAPGNDAKIGGLKVVTENAWFAARPSGTENVYKIYAESFVSFDHLKQVQNEAQSVVKSALEP